MSMELPNLKNVKSRIRYLKQMIFSHGIKLVALIKVIIEPQTAH